jgi:hypothetical protein
MEAFFANPAPALHVLRSHPTGTCRCTQQVGVDVNDVYRNWYVACQRTHSSLSPWISQLALSCTLRHDRKQCIPAAAACSHQRRVRPLCESGHENGWPQLWPTANDDAGRPKAEAPRLGSTVSLSVGAPTRVQVLRPPSAGRARTRRRGPAPAAKCGGVIIYSLAMAFVVWRTEQCTDEYCCDTN